MSIAIASALYTELTSDSSITGKLATVTSVFDSQAPDDAEFPYIVIQKQGKSRRRVMGGVAFETERWMVKAVDRNISDSNPAEAIREAVETRLINGTLAITGGTLADLFPDGDIDYIEPDGDQLYRHHGSTYRITTTSS